MNAVLLLEVLSTGYFPRLSRLPILDWEFVGPGVQTGDFLDRIFHAGYSNISIVLTEASEPDNSPSTCPRYLVMNLFIRKRLRA